MRLRVTFGLLLIALLSMLALPSLDMSDSNAPPADVEVVVADFIDSPDLQTEVSEIQLEEGYHYAYIQDISQIHFGYAEPASEFYYANLKPTENILRSYRYRHYQPPMLC